MAAEGKGEVHGGLRAASARAALGKRCKAAPALPKPAGGRSGSLPYREESETEDFSEVEGWEY